MRCSPKLLKGFSSLQHLNSCLLLSHLNKLHSYIASRGSSHLAPKYGRSDTRDLDSPHPFESNVWHDIAKGLEFFQSITKVDIGNGTTTALWLDLWFNGSTENLATIFPALFSHTLRPAATVARVLGYPALK